MKRIEVGFLGRIRGGCYCYCFKNPMREIDRINPSILIGKRAGVEECKEECYRKDNVEYYGFYGCFNYTLIEREPSKLFLEYLEEVGELGIDSWSF